VHTCGSKALFGPGARTGWISVEAYLGTRQVVRIGFDVHGEPASTKVVRVYRAAG